MSALPTCRELVVGVDFSPASAAALRLASAWAAGRGLGLELVHAAPPGLPAAAAAALEASLTELARTVRDGEGVDCATALVPGEPLAVLAERAQRGAMRVLGTEGSAAQPLRRAGSTASGACRDGLGPVLLAPPRWRAPGTGRRAPRPSFRRVLVGLSGGERDRRRLEAALELARPERPAAAHVVDVSFGRCYPAAARSSLAEPAEEAARSFLDRFLEWEDELVEVAADGPELELHLVTQGPVHRDLTGLAESQSIELLLLGSGSTAALASALVACPLLVLP